MALAFLYVHEHGLHYVLRLRMIIPLPFCLDKNLWVEDYFRFPPTLTLDLNDQGH